MAETTLDGAELAILINRFEGIARKMTNTLYRTGRSGHGIFLVALSRTIANCSRLPIACPSMSWSGRT
jgi:hypothetical protein